MTEIQRQLFALRDQAYKDFHKKLIPTIDSNRIIGVRTPVLRSMAKRCAGQPEAQAFLHALPAYLL